MKRGLEGKMWESGQGVEYAGTNLLLQSPEFALITTLHHGFLAGHRADALQSIVDAAWLLPRCENAELIRLINEARLLEQFRKLLEYFGTLGIFDRNSVRAELDEKVVGLRAAKANAPRIPPTPAIETALLRRPALYRLWNVLGRKPKLEQLIIQWTGPFSNPLKSLSPRDEYDLRDCAIIDEIAGPGWSWPEPDRKCFWTDRADARLLIPLRYVDDHLLIITFDKRFSPNDRIDIFANGLYVTQKHLSDRLAETVCCVVVDRRMLSGLGSSYHFGRGHTNMMPSNIQPRLVPPPDDSVSWICGT